MNTFPNIFLIGLMGAGKTTVGKQLAKKLHLDFIDADQELEARTGVSIATIFELEGESGFRQREAELIKELVEKPGIVLATGGGAILNANTRQLLQQKGVALYLRARVEDLWKRTKKDRQRPLLQNTDPLKKLQQLFIERNPFYEETAHLVIDTAHHSVDKLVAHIEKNINDYLTTHENTQR
ncbi:MAG: shikimate kinase AroK [Betaproteobacteria bacterium]|nr:shikimate kinase AroK [Betaproteobacteria bacterium]MDE2423217.1 shikimate kinase AroK [Betaproteobacteria bacterium]